jgi:hypothetical protein
MRATSAQHHMADMKESVVATRQCISNFLLGGTLP